MSSFSWTGSFREGQWRAYRKFVLNERRDAPKREVAILDELVRIGDVQIKYAKDANRKTTERRLSIVLDEGSSLQKLMSAYVCLGGNPFDISMFLSPDKALAFEGSESTQPSDGVSTAIEMSYSIGGGPTSADATLLKYQPSRQGGPVINPDAMVGALVEHSRKWVHKEIRFKRNAIEHRIIKLCDLHEQLVQELDDICWATRGYGLNSKVYSTSRYDDDLTVAKIVYTIDSIFRVPSEDGTVSPAADFNLGAAAAYPNLMRDLDDEANTAL